MTTPFRLNRTMADTNIGKALGINTQLQDLFQASELSRIASGAFAKQTLVSNSLRDFHDRMLTTGAIADGLSNAARAAALDLPHLNTVQEMDKLVNSSAVNALNVLPESIGNISAQMAELERSMRAACAVPDTLAEFSELHKLARGLLDQPPFGDVSTSLMRDALGDWRNISIFPHALLDDASARGDFYRSLGFDDALTDFHSVPAYLESLDASALRPSVVPDLVPAYFRGPDLYRNDNEDTDDLALNIEAYRLICSLETNLRQFIVECMRDAFGRSWMKHRIPGDMYKQWQKKRQDDIELGREPRPLIAYADFSDYEKIICRNNNWKAIFQVYFIRKQSIQESLTRLGPVRKCTMHSRVVTPDDHLILVAEVRQILLAIGYTN